ncbi:Uncharacterised protein [Elizabethkingia anophelis]|nr:Uncharacterised protein [Elizabethkingia anophelis]
MLIKFISFAHAKMVNKRLLSGVEVMKMTEKKLQKKFCKSGKSFYLCTRKSETTDRRDFGGGEKNKRSLKIK